MPKRYYKFEDEIVGVGWCMLVFIVVILIAATLIYGHYAP